MFPVQKVRNSEFGRQAFLYLRLGLLWTRWRCFPSFSQQPVVHAWIQSDLKFLHRIHQEEVVPDDDKQAGAGGEEAGARG